VFSIERATTAPMMPWRAVRLLVAARYDNLAKETELRTAPTLAALVFGHGFKLQMLDDLVRAGLAKRYCVTVTAGGRTTGVSVVYMKIMAAGRQAIEE
jgi:hypothetical protein